MARAGRIIAGILVACCVGAAQAVDLSQLHAGQRATIAYPELPSPINGGVAQVQIALPANFDPKRAYGVYLWYNGGGGNSGIDDTFSFTDRCICISLPLMKRLPSDPVPQDMKAADTTPMSDVHLREGDWLKNIKALQAVMRDLRRIAVIDPERSYCGGFSNGGHAVGYMASHSPEFCAMFRGYIFLEGGYDGYGELSTVKLLTGHDKKVYVLGGEKSAAAGMRSGIHEPSLAAKIDSEFVLMVGIGHGYDAKYTPQSRAWIEHKVLYGGLEEAVKTLKAAVAAKKWPTAMAAYRTAARIADERSDQYAFIQGVLADLDKPAAEVAARVDPDKASQSQLRKVVDDWNPCPALTPLRDRCNALGEAQLGKLGGSSDAAKATALRKFIKEWDGYPVRATAQAQLDDFAKADLDKAKAIADDVKRAQAALAVSKSWPETAAATEAVASASEIGEKLLAAAHALQKPQEKAKDLQSLAKAFAGTDIGQQAQSDLTELISAKK